MRLIGFTGGIATGKSTVVERIASFAKEKDRLYIVDADTIAREIVQPGKPAYKAIVEHFGKECLSDSLYLNRAYIANIVFKDASKRKLLNQCTHPFIRREMVRKALVAFLKGYRLALFDIPLLYESHLEKYFSCVAVVSCPLDMQIARVMKRDKLSTDEALARIHAQLSLDVKCRKATYVIDNSKSLTYTESQCRELLNAITPSFLTTCLHYFCFWSVAIMSLVVLKIVSTLESYSINALTAFDLKRRILELNKRKKDK